MVPKRGVNEVNNITGGIIFILALDELKIQHRQQQEETKQLQDQLKATREGIFTLLCNLVTNVDKRLCMTYLECDTKEMAQSILECLQNVEC